MVPTAAYRPRLGRLPAADMRDVAYLMRAVPRTGPVYDKPARFWTSDEVTPDGEYRLRTFINQGLTGTCVGHAWSHWEQAMRDRPDIVNPYDVYRLAVAADEWTDNDHEVDAERSDLQFGTSVRAGAKAMQSLGMLQSYAWAWTLDDVVEAILQKGPVVFGTWWYSSMFETGAGGYITVSGTPEGGHAYLLDGADTRERMIRVHNSWGEEWGYRGYGFLSFDDAARLLAEDGEACFGIPTDAA